MPFSDFGIFLGDVSLWEINHFTKDPLKAQKSVLKKIVRRNKNCELGKKLRLGEVKSIEDYQRIVEQLSKTLRGNIANSIRNFEEQ